jgi:hypothetical protein
VTSQDLPNFRHKRSQVLVDHLHGAVFLEKLTVTQLAETFQAYYGARRIITAFTTARNVPLPRARSIHLSAPNRVLLRYTLILSSRLHVDLSSCLIPSYFPHKTQHAPLVFPFVPHAPPIPLSPSPLSEQCLIQKCRS